MTESVYQYFDLYTNETLCKLNCDGYLQKIWAFFYDLELLKYFLMTSGIRLQPSRNIGRLIM